jgi:hypothetical protein
MPNEWNTFQQQHTSPEAIQLSNKMKDLNKKNKFTHRLGPGGYKAAMLKWTKKEQERRAAGIPDPLEGYTLRMKNFIHGHSRMDDSGQLITSSSEVIKVIKKPRLSLIKRRLVNSHRSMRMTYSAQPSNPKNIKVAREISLQLHRGRKGSRRTDICTRSVKVMIKMYNLHVSMNRNLHNSSLIS